MLRLMALVMAGFTSPEDVATSPQSLLLLLPVVAAIAVVYKATKLPRISAGNFIKESMILFFSIVAFLVIIALALAAIAWLVLE
jgi:hypothetical protein